MQNWEEEFENIINGIDLRDLKDPRFESLTPEEVSRAIVGMNESATYLGRYLLQCMFDQETKLPEELNVYIRELTQLTDTISTILSTCTCPECLGEECDDCTDEYMCEDCVRRLEEEDF